MTKTNSIDKLCLVAGNGELPVRLAKSALANNVELLIIALSNDNLKKLQGLTSNVHRYSVVDIYPVLEKIKSQGHKKITFIGKVPKIDFIKNLYRLDKRLINKIKELKDWNDDSLHFKVLDFAERENGLEIIDQTIFLRELFPKAQCFTSRELVGEEITEAKFALEMAKGIGELDIGQTVVVSNKSVIAVEAIEGTNACIKRAQKTFGFFQRNQRIIVAKTSKPNQDRRFDVPTIGLETIKAMPRHSNLVFEAEETFFVNQDEAITLANQKNISITAFDLGE
jgi:UDP-2,3-diacylglucosamine hydrolase